MRKIQDRSITRANKKSGDKVYDEIVGGTSQEFNEKYVTRGMTKKQIIELWIGLSPEEKLKYSAGMNKQTIAGVVDYTPYNAITGNDLMSAGRVSDPEQKLPGGFNTTKK